MARAKNKPMCCQVSVRDATSIPRTDTDWVATTTISHSPLSALSSGGFAPSVVITVRNA
ncbi:MAG TPA: hypothetical protein VKV57_00450 [bacterium]|nr:hypothetical protein [bacterium]